MIAVKSSDLAGLKASQCRPLDSFQSDFKSVVLLKGGRCDISPNRIPGWGSNVQSRTVRGRIRTTLTGVQPPLDGKGIDGESNPESPAEELSWLKVGQAAGGKEKA